MSIEITPNETEAIRSIQWKCWKNSEDHGFHVHGTESFGLRLALIHSEISEALEEWRNGTDPALTYYNEHGKPEGVPIELADAVIRIFDMAEVHGIDLSAAIEEKHRFNKGRPFMHGKVA